MRLHLPLEGTARAAIRRGGRGDVGELGNDHLVLAVLSRTQPRASSALPRGIGKPAAGSGGAIVDVIPLLVAERGKCGRHGSVNLGNVTSNSLSAKKTEFLWRTVIFFLHKRPLRRDAQMDLRGWGGGHVS